MENINTMIDHTLLKADASSEEIEKLCKEAKKYKFATVCVNPCHVEECSSLLEGSEVKVATVVGFPLGANTKEVKAFETQDVISKGAREIDMVLNIGALKEGNLKLVKEDIEGVVQVAKGQALVKVIIETALLSREEKIKACEIVMEAGADYVKTSTGFSSGGASLEDLELMKSLVEDRIKIKASGGIRDYETAKAMLEAGAQRLGTSSGISIVNY